MLCRALKSHSYPCKAVQASEAANRICHHGASRPIAGPGGGGSCWDWSVFAASLEQLLLSETQEGTREGEQTLSVRSVTGRISSWKSSRLTSTAGLIFREDGCFYQCKQAWALPGLLNQASRRGGRRGRGGGATAGENAASSNEKFPLSSQPRPAASSPEKSFCTLRYVRISNLRGHMERGLVTLAGLAAQLFAQDSWDHVRRRLGDKNNNWHVLDLWHTAPRPRGGERGPNVAGSLFVPVQGLLHGCSRPLGSYWSFASAAHGPH